MPASLATLATLSLPFPIWLPVSLLLTIALAISAWLLLAHIQTRQQLLVLTERVDHILDRLRGRLDREGR